MFFIPAIQDYPISPYNHQKHYPPAIIIRKGRKQKAKPVPKVPLPDHTLSITDAIDTFGTSQLMAQMGVEMKKMVAEGAMTMLSGGTPLLASMFVLVV